LWIDALSIDQANIHERNHQVRQMGDIYKKASCVLVWLGEKSEDSDEALDLLVMLAEDVHWHQSPVFEIPKKSQPYDKQLVSRRAKRFQAIYGLIGRSWWQRLWCIQEITLAQEAKLI